MKVLFFLLLVTASRLWAAESLPLKFKESSVKQGTLVEAQLLLSSSEVNLPILKLKDDNLSETIFFYSVGPLVKTSDSTSYYSDVKLVFLKVPDTNEVSVKIDGKDIRLLWNNLAIHPSDSKGEMIWKDFKVADILDFKYKYLIFLVIVPIFYFGFLLIRKWQEKKKIAELRSLLKQELWQCKSYEEVVSLWKTKHKYLSAFPTLKEEFQSLESVLFKYQFKPSQSDIEKKLVMEAYAKFVDGTQGVLRGI